MMEMRQSIVQKDNENNSTSTEEMHFAVHTEYSYHVRGIIGESNIWQFALKMQLVSF